MANRDTIAAFRFGYGLPQTQSLEEEWRALREHDWAAQRWPGITQDQVLASMKAMQDARDQMRSAAMDDDPTTDPDVFSTLSQKRRRDIYQLAYQGIATSFARAVGGNALRERLVRFWADHFSVAPRVNNQRAWPAAMIEEVIRPNIAGRFSDLLIASATHPAMLLYLDQYRSFGPNSIRGKNRGTGLNENYARELLELHTLGVGTDYSQDDIRELAELLTGLAYNAEAGFVFDNRRVEPGGETVLGKYYDGKGLDPIHALLQDLAVHPATARHLSRKLAVHFVSDQPDPQLIEDLTQAWLQSGGDLHHVTGVLITHPASWQPQTEKIRQPFEFLVATARAMGVPPDQLYKMSRKNLERNLLGAMEAMGESWLNIPGPNGRPEAPQAWISPQGMAARLDWALAAPERLSTPLPDPRRFVHQALGDKASEKLVWAVSAAEIEREGLGLILASPEFNRR